MKTHPYMARILREGTLTFIYGPPGTGKSRLALHIVRVAEERGFKTLVVATESGALLAFRSLGLNVNYAKTIDEMAKLVASGALSGSYVVVDTINSYYRGDPDYYSRRMLAAACSFMRISGGLALGQASEVEGRLGSPGYSIIGRYAHIVGVTSKAGEGKFYLKILKPEERLTAFRIEGDNIVWL